MQYDCNSIHKSSYGAKQKRHTKMNKLTIHPYNNMSSFADHLCYLCIVFVMLSRLFIAVLWSHEGKVLTSWLLFGMFIVILLLSHLICLGRCGT